VATPSNPLSSAEIYWNVAAETYEEDFSGTIVGKIRRSVVQQALARSFQPGRRVLEINCGTGIDAVFLACRGVHVVACDLSPRMIELARALAAKEDVSPSPDFRVLATEHLSTLVAEAPFDGAFSNFSGLNCIEDLHQVADDLGRLLEPNARLILCMMGRFVPLEILWFLAHGRLRRAFYRLRSPRTHYAGTTGIVIKRPTVIQIERQMQPAFRLVGWKGIGIVVPPSYAEPFATRFPRFLHFLAAVDRRIGSLPLFRNMADCVLLELERTPMAPRK
jgi:SAM-dependent methyltransferase